MVAYPRGEIKSGEPGEVNSPLQDAADRAFQVRRFREREQYWMVRRLRQRFEDLH